MNTEITSSLLESPVEEHLLRHSAGCQLLSRHFVHRLFHNIFRVNEFSLQFNSSNFLQYTTPGSSLPVDSVLSYQCVFHRNQLEIIRSIVAAVFRWPESLVLRNHSCCLLLPKTNHVRHRHADLKRKEAVTMACAPGGTWPSQHKIAHLEL